MGIQARHQMRDEEKPRAEKSVGSEQRKTSHLRTVQRYELFAARTRGSFGAGTPIRLDRNNGYVLSLQRRSLQSSNYWVDGKPVPLAPLRSGQFLLLDLDRDHSSVLSGDMDCISTFVSRGALQRFREEHDLPIAGSLRDTNGVAFEDGVVRNLAESLLPAFERPETANRLFVDHVVSAVLSHLTASYGERSAVVRAVRGGLAPWQEKRAKELMLAHIDGDVGLDELAASCELSRSHFARAFKVTTGSSPFRWLLARRIERAKNLLLNSGLPVDQVAEQCGFVDQSHFTRTFVKVTNATPARWRRLRRS